MINSSSSQPTYIGSDYTTLIGNPNGAGRPSVRISTKRSWTHGLFIGDFNHSPAGICGTWPAFWTLGPNWPYNGEIDIMEGANLNTYNGMTLHASPNCTIAGDSRLMSGQLQSSNCAYYPNYNVGCSISDRRSQSYGTNFNTGGGGVYAMQWTSDYVAVWFFPRGSIPADITNKTPNPSGWGLPAAEFQGSCQIDQKFQAHKIVMNNAFCGEYAGASTVWNSSTNSCAASTGYATCNAYVAGQPGAFQNAYWSINSVRVYQLVDSGSSATSSSPYIASLQPTSTISTTTGSTPTPTPTTALCPGYNFTVVQLGAFSYEIECGVNPGGHDIGAPYSGFQVNSFEDCIAGCSYWNANISANYCAAVTYQFSSKACYWKKDCYAQPANAAYNGARLIYYAYPQVTDDPRSQTLTSSSTSYVQTTPTPNTWRYIFFIKFDVERLDQPNNIDLIGITSDIVIVVDHNCTVTVIHDGIGSGQYFINSTVGHEFHCDYRESINTGTFVFEFDNHFDIGFTFYNHSSADNSNSDFDYGDTAFTIKHDIGHGTQLDNDKAYAIQYDSSGGNELNDDDGVCCAVLIYYESSPIFY
ncbi:hypothetical protein LTS17_008050 [Exophiala oligosperma]